MNINDMILEGATISDMFETIKVSICDNYCKFPEQFKCGEYECDDEELVEKHCMTCPLNVL